MSVSYHPTRSQHVLWYRMEEHTQLFPIVAQREIYRADVGRALNRRNIQGEFDSRPSCSCTSAEQGCSRNSFTNNAQIQPSDTFNDLITELNSHVSELESFCSPAEQASSAAQLQRCLAVNNHREGTDMLKNELRQHRQQIKLVQENSFEKLRSCSGLQP